MRLENKVALMCGVGLGMGRASALLFAQEGAKIAITARRDEHINEIASRIQHQVAYTTAVELATARLLLAGEE